MGSLPKANISSPRERPLSEHSVHTGFKSSPVSYDPKSAIGDGELESPTRSGVPVSSPRIGHKNRKSGSVSSAQSHNSVVSTLRFGKDGKAIGTSKVTTSSGE